MERKCSFYPDIDMNCDSNCKSCGWFKQWLKQYLYQKWLEARGFKLAEEIRSFEQEDISQT